MAQEHGGAADYGATLSRAQRIWIVTFETKQQLRKYAENMPTEGRTVDLEGTSPPYFATLGPRPVSMPIVKGIASIQPDIEQYLPLPELSQRWIEEYAAEIEVFLGRLGEEAMNDVPVRLRTLINELKSCSSLDLTPTGRNQEAFRRLREHKENLLQRLEEIAVEWPIDPPLSEQGQRLTWRGHTRELAVLIDLLEREGWIKGGRNRNQLAQRIAAMFNGPNGEPMEGNTLRTYLAKAYNPLPREGVKFTATTNPDKNQ